VALLFLTLALVRARERQMAEQERLGERAQEYALSAAQAFDAALREARILMQSVDLSLSALPAAQYDPLLKALANQTPLPYRNLFALSLDGRLLGAARDTAFAPAVVSAECLRLAAARRAFTVCPSTRQRVGTTETWQLTYVQPCYAPKSGAPDGYVVATTVLDSLEAVRLARRLPDGSVLTLLDSVGIVRVRTLNADGWIGRQYPDFSAREGLPPLGSDTVITSDIDRRARLFGTTASRETGWQMYVGIPVEVAFAPSRRQFVQDILLAAITSLAILLIGYWSSARLLRPIESLTEDARAISDGDMSRRSRIGGDDEVADLARTFNQMADAIVERSAQLAASQEQLRQVQKLEALGAFAGGIAHEFNNYLSSILGHAELALLEDTSATQARDELGGIVTSAQRAAELTRQVMVFSRRQVTAARRVEVAPLVHDMARLLERLTGDRVALRVNVDERVGAVSIDPGQLEQVMMNLAVNARDAMPGGGQLTITVDHATAQDRERLALADAPFVRFTVSDSGSGVPEHVRAHIFEPFFTTKDRNHGTGLGLSISYGIVQAVGGAIELDSTTASGATFRFYLPESTGAPVADMATPVTTASASRAAGEQVLVVEDDASVAEVARRLLARAGYDVVVMRDGESALAALDSRRFDLLVSDVVMPGMSGAVLVQEARRRHPDMRVLLMSGYPDDDLVALEIAAQRVAFLAKPFSHASLLTKVRELLDDA
jgi:signal transduction histidine kinase/BarA-like signal transduction histidine kinase